MSLIKVMIVDDEILAIEDLKNLISWDKHGFHIVAEATNGQKALELYKKYRPDIIFMDIRMPVMDGLLLSSKILQCNEDVKIVLLTAYKDFEYAKQALKIGVFNYLVKHEINEHTLLEELGHIKKKLQLEEGTLKLRKQELIKKVLEGKVLSDSDLGYWKENIDVCNGNFALIILKIDTPWPIFQLNHTKNDEDSASYSELFNLNQDRLSEEISFIDTLRIDIDIYAVLLGLQRKKSQLELRNILYRISKELQDNLREKTGHTLSITVATTCFDGGNLSRVCKRLLNALNYAVFAGKEKIIWPEEIPIALGEAAKDFSEEINRLNENMKALRYDEAIKLVEEIFNKLVSPYWDLGGLKKTCRSLTSALESFRKENNLVPFETLIDKGKIDDSAWYSIQAIRNWYTEEFRRAAEEVQNSRKLIYSRKIWMIIQYIEKHYAEDLVVEKVAEVFDMSGVYLSQLFKKETGQTFLKYLTNYRVQRAKEFLESNKYNVNEVALKVGYNTSQYFSKIFHEVSGVTPKHYMMKGGDVK